MPKPSGPYDDAFWDTRARLRAERAARTLGPQTCVDCGAAFAATQNARRHCFTCRPVPPQSKAHPRAYTRRNKIGVDARLVMAEREPVCQRCGYSLFVETCHIRAVHSFPPNTPLRDINAPNNLVYLCPNCHHEFDAGLWSVTAIDRDAVAARPVTRRIARQGKSWGHSPYRGVRWDKSRQRWQASIACDGQRYNLGRFIDEREAARAYNAAAIRLRGERAILNDVDDN